MKALLLAFVFLVSGCTSSVIVDHARAAQVVGPLITTAGEVMLVARTSERDACVAAHDEACLDAVIARWVPALTAYNLVVVGYEGWVEGLTLANLARASEDAARAILLPLVVSLIRLYGDLETVLEPFEELDLPDLSDLGLLTVRRTP